MSSNPMLGQPGTLLREVQDCHETLQFLSKNKKPIGEALDRSYQALDKVTELITSRLWPKQCESKESEEKLKVIDTFLQSYVHQLTSLLLLRCTEGQNNGDANEKYLPVIEYFRRKIVRVAQDIASRLEKKQRLQLLDTLIDEWDKFLIFVVWMQMLFRSIDQANSTKVHPSLTSISLRTWYDCVYKQASRAVADAVVFAMGCKRLGDNESGVSSKTIPELVKFSIEFIIHMGTCHDSRDINRIATRRQMARGEHLYCPGLSGHRSLRCYDDDLEPKLLDETCTFYNAKAKEWMQTDSTGIYLKKTEAAIIEEEFLVKHLLGSRSVTKISHILNEKLLVSHYQELLDAGTGLEYMLKNRKTEDLLRLTSLFERISKLDLIASFYKKFVVHRGRNLMRERLQRVLDKKKPEKAEADTKSIIDLIKLRRECKLECSEAFGSRRTFESATECAFDDILLLFNNVDGNNLATNISHLLAGYVHFVYNTESKFDNTSCFEEELKDIIELFVHIADKDMFRAYYQEYLKVRLLRKPNVDLEKVMVNLLTTSQGKAFTNKLSIMINDVARFEAIESRKQNSWWVKNCRQDVCKEVTVRVLSLSNWPVEKDVKIASDATMPEAMTRVRTEFEKYCQLQESNLSSKKILWSKSLGDITLTFTSLKGKFFVKMNPLQAMVCLTFTDGDAEMTVNELQKILNIDKSQTSLLNKIVHSLSCHKYKLLKKSGSSKKVTGSDVLRINCNFKEKKKAFAMALPPLDMKRAQKSTHENRKHQIQAAIVRVAKTRKTLSQNQLVQEVMQQLKNFAPKNRDIKTQIDAMIGREYLERDKEDMTKLTYLA